MRFLCHPFCVRSNIVIFVWKYWWMISNPFPLKTTSKTAKFVPSSHPQPKINCNYYIKTIKRKILRSYNVFFVSHTYFFTNEHIFYWIKKKYEKKNYEWMRGEKNIVIKIMNIPCLVEIYQIIRGFMFRSFCCSSIAKKKTEVKKSLRWECFILIPIPSTWITFFRLGVWWMERDDETGLRDNVTLALFIVYMCVFWAGHCSFRLRLI